MGRGSSKAGGGGGGRGSIRSTNEIIEVQNRNIRAMSALKQEIKRYEGFLNPNIYVSSDIRQRAEINMERNKIALEILQKKQNLLEAEYKVAQKIEAKKSAKKRKDKVHLTLYRGKGGD